VRERNLVLVAGGDEIGSAVAVYLAKSNVPTAMVVHDSEIHLRRPICFAEAAFSGKKRMEGVTAELVTAEDLDLVSQPDERLRWKEAIDFKIRNGHIPVFLNSDLPAFPDVLGPTVIVRASESHVHEIEIDDAGLVIGFFPHHVPGKDCHVAVETRLNYWIGDVYAAAPDKRPDFDMRFFKNPFEHVNSPLEGVFAGMKNIGDKIRRNEPFGTVNEIEIRSPYEGQIWGLFHSGKIIQARQPLALVYEGVASDAYLYFDFKHRAIAGAVLTEMMRFL